MLVRALACSQFGHHRSSRRLCLTSILWAASHFFQLSVRVQTCDVVSEWTRAPLITSKNKADVRASVILIQRPAEIPLPPARLALPLIVNLRSGSTVARESNSVVVIIAVFPSVATTQRVLESRVKIKINSNAIAGARPCQLRYIIHGETSQLNMR